MKPFVLGDIEWTADNLHDQRENIIQLRDSAIGVGSMDWALILSHQIALLAHLIQLMKEES